VVQKECQEQLTWYRSYYSLALFCTIPLIITGCFTTAGTSRGCGNLNTADGCRGLRKITDELGYNQSQSDFNIFWCLKSSLRFTLLAVLVVAYIEAVHDVALRDQSCHNEDLADELGTWFGWALSIRLISVLWDLLINILLFKGFSCFCDISDHEILEEKTEYIQQPRHQGFR